MIVIFRSERLLAEIRIGLDPRIKYGAGSKSSSFPWIPRSGDSVTMKIFTLMPQYVVAANFSLRRRYAG